MPHVCYQITGANTGTVAGVNTITVAVPFRIYAVTFRFRATGGAGNGAYSFELAVNQSSTAYSETNNPLRNVIIAAATFQTLNASVQTFGGPYGPLPVDVPIRTGDVLSLNQVQTGTAAASLFVALNLYGRE